MEKKRSVLFIDRDGTLVIEPPGNKQLDSLDQLEFYPKVFRNLHFIRQKMDFELVMVSNQDGLGTATFPEETFWPVHLKILKAFENEGVVFDDIQIDRTFQEENILTRKPGTKLLSKYLTDDYDMSRSYVIGDRLTDVELAKNLSCKAFLLNDPALLDYQPELKNWCLVASPDWDQITEILYAGLRTATIERVTKETDVHIELNIDGSGHVQINTGLHFFNHLLEQLGKHSGMDLIVEVKGDLMVDEHHTIEDTAIALGEALLHALENKRGIERYGFCLPMDDCLCLVAIDLGGRPWLVWETEFHRESVGDMPTELFMHFFKSFSDAAKMNVHIRANGQNEHHKIEGIFKAFARALQMAITRDISNFQLPTTKGVL